ncbi:Cro/Cl family transcriptional regulator [Enterobacter asburiae]|uniref:Cro/Cl family transcriptional regulator n=1 Tax=Enterobacter asburiae TaxID=61645 RepID=UPI003BEF0D82
MSDFSAILRAVGFEVVAKATNRTQRQVYKWEKNKTLPRSDFTGETLLARAIAEASNGLFTEQEILNAAIDGRRQR